MKTVRSCACSFFRQVWIVLARSQGFAVGHFFFVLKVNHHLPLPNKKKEHHRGMDYIEWILKPIQAKATQG